MSKGEIKSKLHNKHESNGIETHIIRIYRHKFVFCTDINIYYIAHVFAYSVCELTYN